MTDDLRRDMTDRNDPQLEGTDMGSGTSPGDIRESAQDAGQRAKEAVTGDPHSDETRKPEREPDPLLREGADALDAADIEDPDRQL